MTTTNQSHKLYMHTGAQECIAFKSRFKAAVHSKADNGDLLKVMNGQEVASEAAAQAANAILFYMLVEKIGDDSLVGTITDRFNERGADALNYIEGCWLAGDDDNKLESAYDQYQTMAYKQFPATTKSGTVREHFDKMGAIKTGLKGSDYELTNQIHSINMANIVKRMSPAHQVSIQIAAESLKTLRTDPAATAVKLEGIVDAVKPEVETDDKVSVEALHAEIKQLQALVHRQNQKPKPDTREKCSACGVPGHKDDKCHAKMLADGKTPPQWASKPEEVRERIQQRADEIKEKGLFKDRPFVGLASVVDVDKIRLTAMTLSLEEPDDPGALVLAVDSQAAAGTKYHFIKDKSLFTSWDKDAARINVACGFADDWSEGVGTIEFMTQGRHTILHDCVYVPTIKHNLINVYALKDKNIFVDLIHNTITFDNGTLRMSDVFTLEVHPLPQSLAAMPTFVQRGKHGPLHIDTKPLTGEDKALFDLYAAH